MEDGSRSLIMSAFTPVISRVLVGRGRQIRLRTLTLLTRSTLTIGMNSYFDCISHVKILPFNTMVEMSIPCCVDLLHIDTLELMFSRYAFIEVSFPFDVIVFSIPFFSTTLFL